LQPDVLVVRREDVGPANITAPLLLAVEVLSPGTRAKGLLLKRGIYEESGVASYWIVDPDEPSVTVLELDAAGRYAEAGHAVGDEQITIAKPYAVTVTPRRLVER
jgi:Uma2 family endonuclease